MRHADRKQRTQGRSGEVETYQNMEAGKGWRGEERKGEERKGEERKGRGVERRKRESTGSLLIFSFFFLFFPELRTEPRALCLQVKRFTTELNPQPHRESYYAIAGVGWLF